jgi:hypothetical protein
MNSEGKIVVNAMARKQQLYRSLRQLHDTKWNACKLGRSIKFLEGYAGTSRKIRKADDLREVGLVRSTRSLGKPSTWGRDQRDSENLNKVKMRYNQESLT